MKQSDGRGFSLEQFARETMEEHGLIPDFSPEIEREVEQIGGPSTESGGQIGDLRHLMFFSIDNDDSRDLDQLTYAERLGNGNIKIFIAVAEVDAVVKKSSAIDERAQNNTTSVYAPGRVFPMLPEELSTDWTSLNEHEDRLAMIIETVVDAGGNTEDSRVYRARVHNYAKLAYDNVAAWLKGEEELPQKIARMNVIEDQIRLQVEAADRLRAQRAQRGALELETIEPRAVMTDGKLVDIRLFPKNEARELIEDFMIAANGVVARFLEEKNYPVFRRVVREPDRWNRIVAVAEEYGDSLPPTPDSSALVEFLRRRRKADPLRFPDLSLTIVKLLGSGEYIIDPPGQEPPGHFGLAVRDYSHSTAPNRRYPDLITHRILKACLAGSPSPYTIEELASLAEHCTSREDDANKVERTMRKAAAAVLLSKRIGDHFEGIVTGASKKGVWVRLFHPPVEGKVVRGENGLDVGDKVKVKLLQADPERGFIDFQRLHGR
jgi:VacB/RNase II family 3'-5' exoribonuclease